jgi:predicted flap endonuclease-1-like 5' DNA nuclease
VIQSLGGAAALAPEPLERTGIGTVVPPALAPAGIFNLKEIAAGGATEVGTGVLPIDARTASKTA